MTVKKGVAAMAIGAVLMTIMVAAPRADAQRRVIVRPSFGFSYGFGPAWYRPYRPWGPSYVYVPGPQTGDVKLHTHFKNESVYVDGGFAGVTDKLKKFSLQPGNHQIEIRGLDGRILFQNTIHVIAGQTVDINC